MTGKTDIHSLILRYLAIEQRRPRSPSGWFQIILRRREFEKCETRHLADSWQSPRGSGKTTPERAATVVQTHLGYVLLAPLLDDDEPHLILHASETGAYVFGTDLRIRGGAPIGNAPRYDTETLSAVLAPGRTRFLYHPVRGATMTSGHEMMTSRQIALALEPAIGSELSFWSSLARSVDLTDEIRLKLRHDPAGCVVVSRENDDDNGFEETILTVLSSHGNPVQPLFAKRRLGRQALTAIEKAGAGRIAARSAYMTALAEKDERIWIFEKTVIDDLARRGVIHGAPDLDDAYVAFGSPDSVDFLDMIIAGAEEAASLASRP